MSASDLLARALAKRLDEQLARLSFHDVLIKVQGQEFECHRFILSACSQHFRDMLSNGTCDQLPQVVELNEITSETFKLVLECVYGAKENFTVENVAGVWYAAKHLQIDFLCEACENFQFQRLSKDCCVKLSIDAKRLNADRLLGDARKLMIAEFDYLRKRDDLLDLDFDELKVLVSSDDLGVKSEDEVIETILRWTRFQSNEANRGSDTGVDSTILNSKVIKEMLPELFKSARVCLVNGTFLHTLLDDDCVLKSPTAFAVAREALLYQLQPGRRHDYCPPYAMHRSLSPLQNVTVVLSLDVNGAYKMSCRTPDGTWYVMYQPSQFKVSAVTFGNDIYTVSACGPYPQTQRYTVANCSWLNLPNVNILRPGNALVCVDNYVYIIGGTNNKSIDRFNAQEEQRAPNSVMWEKVGDLQWEVTNFMATAIGNYIVVFGKTNDSTMTRVQSFNTSTMTAHVYNDIMGEHAPMVNFKNGKDTFVLLETGDLWKVVNCDNQDLKMEFQGKLFEDKLSLHGAVVFNRELLILATGLNPQMPKEFSTVKMDNVLTVKIIERNGFCLLNTVIAKKFLTTKEV